MRTHRLPARFHGPRLLAGLLALCAAATVAVAVASGSVARSAYYSCSIANVPVIAGAGVSSLSASATLTGTVDPKGIPTVVGWVTGATLTTNLPGPNNDLIYYAKVPDPITVNYQDPLAPSQPLFVNVSYVAGIYGIHVHLPTDGGGALVPTTAAEVAAQIAATGAASVLVSTSNAQLNSGAGLVAPMGDNGLSNPGLSGTGPALPAGPAQAISISISGLSPDTPYALFLVATNQCDPASGFSSAYVPLATLMRAQAGITVEGQWDSAPTDTSSTISGTVVVAPDSAGGGAGANDGSVTCSGALAFDSTITLGDPQILSTCAAPYKSGASVKLTATAGPGSYFDHWEGPDCAAWTTQASCYTTVVGALDDAAIFTNRPQLAVTFTGPGDGTVTSSPAGISCTYATTLCQAGYNPGTKVTLTAIPSTGGALQAWGGDATPCGHASTCTLTMDADKNVAVDFVGKPTLTVFRTGSGEGTVTSAGSEIHCSNLSALCSASFAAGSKVTLTATAAPNSTFMGWGSDFADCYGTGATCVVSAGWSESITAVFATGHTLAITPSGNGSGVVTSSPSGISCPPSCSYPFAEGTGVTLSVDPLSGSQFAGWDDGPCFDRDPAAGCTVTLTDDLELPVVFTNPSLSTLKRGARTSYKGCTVVGTSRNDVLYGTPGSDVICGGGGNDMLVGGGGNDILVGGTGNDRLVCSGSCELLGGAGSDTLIAKGTGFSKLYGGAGNDVLLARNNARNLLDGGTGRNTARFDRTLDVLRKIQRKL
jgi:hypothetical protein